MPTSIVEADSYIVLPTQLSDVDAVRICGTRAFGAASFQGYIFPASRAHLTPPEEKWAWRNGRLRKMLQAGDLLHFKCVPESDHSKVVGYAAWHRPGHFSPGRSLADVWGMKAKKDGEGEERKLKPESDLTAQAGPEGAKPPGLANGDAEGEKEEADDYPACMDVEAQRDCMGIMDRERKKSWGDDANYWCTSRQPSPLFARAFTDHTYLDLAGLAIDPDYQGRGLARKMVDMGLAWADADGVPAYLEATPEGAKIYPKFGFKKVGEYGFFDGAHVCEFHIRQPGASQPTAAGVAKA